MPRMSQATRALCVSIHRWVGIALLAIIFVQAVTGTVVSFRHELNRLLHPATMMVEARPAAVPYSQILANLQAAFPGAVPDRIYFPKTATDVYLARLNAGENVIFASVDPYSGSVLHSGSVFAFPIETAFYLHNDLLAGTAGHYLVGFVGIGLFALCVLGLVLWWPGRRHLRHGFRIQLKGPRRRQLFDLHRVPGAALSLVFIVVSLTGSAIALDSFVRPALAAIAPFNEPPQLPDPSPTSSQTASVDEVLVTAMAAIGSTHVRDWQFAATHRLRFYDTDNPRPDALDTLWLDKKSGRVLAMMRAEEARIGNKILDWMFPIHTGRVLGLTGRILVCVSGIVLLLVSVCGLWMWLERRRATRRARSAALAGNAASS